MKLSFTSTVKVSEAYYRFCSKDSSMECDLFAWIGYTALGLIVLWFLTDRCYKLYQRYVKKEDENVDEFIPATRSTSSSFTYVAPKKPDINPPQGTNDGLSDFEDSILFDQPLSLSHDNPYCKQNAEKGYTSSDEPIVYSSSSVTGRKGQCVDTLKTIDDMIFHKSTSNPSLDDYDNICNRTYSIQDIKQNTSESSHDLPENVTTHNNIDIESPPFPGFQEISKQPYNNMLKYEIIADI